MTSVANRRCRRTDAVMTPLMVLQVTCGLIQQVRCTRKLTRNTSQTNVCQVVFKLKQNKNKKTFRGKSRNENFDSVLISISIRNIVRKGTEVSSVPTWFIDGFRLSETIPLHSFAWSCRHSNCLLLAEEHLMMLLLEHGTVCRRMGHRHQHCLLFVKDWKRICFANLILTLFLNLVILFSPYSGFEVALLLRQL